MEEISSIIKEPVELIYESIYTKLAKDCDQNDQFIDLFTLIERWITQNENIKKQLKYVNGNSIFQIAFTIFVARYTESEEMLTYRMTQIGRSLRYTSPLNTAIIFKEVAESRFVANRPVLIRYLKKTGDDFANEAECVHLLGEMCRPHSYAEWSFFLESINDKMRCMMKQYLLFVSRHQTGELHHRNDPLIDYKLEQDAKRYVTNAVLRQNRHHLLRLLVHDDCPTFKTDFETCDNDLFSYQAYSYLSSIEDKECSLLYGTSTDFFKFSKFHCTHCISNYKKICDNAISCSLKKDLETNRQMLSTIYQCAYMRVVYKNQCIETSDTNHEKQIKEKQNAVDHCLTIIDKQTNRAN